MQYRLRGNYGTFVIERTVEADTAEEAHLETGIATTLIAAGWEFAHWPDGEEWEVEPDGHDQQVDGG